MSKGLNKTTNYQKTILRWRDYLLILMVFVGGGLSCLATFSPDDGQSTAKPKPGVETHLVMKAQLVSLDEVGIDRSVLDQTIDPCVDFYKFACGGWLNGTSIPQGHSRWMRTFSEIKRKNLIEQRVLLEEAVELLFSQSFSVKSNSGKLGAFYASCMDEEKIAETGTQPLKKLFSEIQKIDGPNTLARALAMLHQHQVWAFFQLSALQDFKDATRLIGVLDQAGLGLSSSEYYINGTNYKRRRIREAYFHHIRKMFGILGMPSSGAEVAAKEIIKVETSLARVSKTKRQRRNPAGMYNKIDLKGVRIKAPRFPWSIYFERIGYPDIVDINVTAPLFLAGFNTIVAQASSRALQNYLRWHLLISYAHALPKPFREERLRFRRFIEREKIRVPRWMQCVDSAQKMFGDILSQAFVDKFFKEQSKEKVLSEIEVIRKVFAENFGKLNWMDDITRKRALDKLQKLSYHVGYPHEWQILPIDVADSYLATLLNGAMVQTEAEWRLVGQSVDRSRWEVLPSHVGSYYHPLRNQLIFPAGVLQPPFYSENFHTAVNLGSMGAVVAHELSHGFDSQGSRFDGYGNLHTWWTLKSQAAYEEKTKCFVDQYSQYSLADGLFVNGDHTLSENIADLGGVKIAYAAFEAARGRAVDVKIAEGYTEEQLFFISNAQVWCTKATVEDIRRRVSSDPHANARSRVNGTLSNLPSFAEAFQCEPSTPMVNANQCSIW